MKSVNILVLLATAALLTACNQNTPAAADQPVTQVAPEVNVNAAPAAEAPATPAPAATPDAAAATPAAKDSGSTGYLPDRPTE